MKNFGKLKGQFTLVLILFFALSSCTREYEPKDSLETLAVNQKSFQSANELELYGIEHNRFLDFITTIEDFESRSNQELFTFGKSYSTIFISYPCGSLDWSDFSQTYAHSSDLLSKTPEDAVNQLVSEKVFSKDFYYIALEFYKILAEEKNLESFQARVMKLENRITSRYKVNFNSASRYGNEASFF